MNKSELIEAIASHANLNKAQAGQALEGITSAIESALKTAMPYRWWVLAISKSKSVQNVKAETHKPVLKSPLLRQNHLALSWVKL